MENTKSKAYCFLESEVKRIVEEVVVLVSDIDKNYDEIPKIEEWVSRFEGYVVSDSRQDKISVIEAACFAKFAKVVRDVLVSSMQFRDVIRLLDIKNFESEVLYG
jgi:hypothetical protein